MHESPAPKLERVPQITSRQLGLHDLCYILFGINDHGHVKPVADLKGGTRNECPPGGLNSFNSCGFLESLAKSYVGPLGGFVVPPRGNPGSDTVSQPYVLSFIT